MSILIEDLRNLGPLHLVCSNQIWLDRFEDIWTGESQSVGESVLAHDGFFLRSIGIEFH